MKKINPKKASMILLWGSIGLFFSMLVFLVISFYSNLLVTKVWRYIVIGLMVGAIGLFIWAIWLLKKHKHGLNFKKGIRWLFSILFGLYAAGCCGFLFLLYGPAHGFRDWLITTAMATMHHKHYCQWFYDDDIINKVLNSNYIQDFDEDTDASLIDFNKVDKEANEYEKEILKHDKDDLYKIIRFKVNGCDAYLAAVYDASKIKVGVSKWLGRSGQYIYDMAQEQNAVLAINGGGFFDPGYNSNGANPVGVTIKDGKIISNSSTNGNVIGFNYDNVLLLTKNQGAQAAIEAGYRDAVTMNPFLIVNGQPAFMKGNGGWGYAARTAIGQRADGIVLMLVVDSNEFRTKGASMVDLTEIMQRYGAVNAANLDGGTSSAMVEHGKIINDPIDSTLAHKTRGIPTAFLVIE